METHHPHHVTHKKKWTEYLLEFFMLFLAVFLSFSKQISSLILLVLFALLNPQNSYGQETGKMNDQKKQSRENKLVGTWKLISYSDFDSVTNKWVQPYGELPQGYFTYTSTNIVNLNISRENSLKLSQDSAKRNSISYYNLIENYSFGYFGIYSVDWEKSIVTHHVKGGSVFWYNDTDQPRPFIFKGDTLIIGNLSTKKRMLVRAD
jgi:hypothetical protein